MKTLTARSVSASLVVLFVLGAGSAGCSADSEVSETQDSAWVVHPNGTADRATVTLKFPTGFDPAAPGQRPWQFFFGDVHLEPGVPTVVPTTAANLIARTLDPRNFGREQVLAANVKPQVGFDTQLTFGALEIEVPGGYRVAKFGDVYCNKDPNACFTYAPEGSSPWLAAAPVSLNVKMKGLAPVLSENNWLFANRYVPLPAGSGTARLTRHDDLVEAPFTIVKGQVTSVQMNMADEPVFEITAHQADPQTMPLNSNDPQDTWAISCESDWGGAKSTEQPFGSKLKVYGAGQRKKCALSVGRSWAYGGDLVPIETALAVPPPTKGLDSFTFTVDPAGGIDVELHRIEVDHVTLTDENPPRTVEGTFTVDKVRADGTTMRLVANSLLGTKEVFPTHSGLVVTSGKYRVAITYPAALGPKTISYESDL